ncbi:MAG: hypothetical protein IKQ31_01400 [Clostridia bacterium]|nr:hypothetical protein [Clostridia bacterium]
MRFYNAAQDEARKIEDTELNRVFNFYRQTQKQWKREYREYKKGKKRSNEAYISFAQWNQDKLEALNSESPEQFKDYCNGYTVSTSLKAGTVAATALAPYVAVPLIGLGMWLTGGLSLLAGIGLIAAGAAVRILAPIVGRRYLARRRLIDILSNPNSCARKLKFKFFNRAKGEKRVQTLTFTNEETRKTSLFARILKWARMPKIMQEYFDYNKTDDAKDNANVEVVAQAEKQEPTKEDKKKEWYKENLETAEKDAEKAAEQVAEKAEEVAEKVEVAAEKATEKAEEVVEKVVEKPAPKTKKAVNKTADAPEMAR